MIAILTFIASFIFYIYLLDLSNKKPQKRNYKKLLNGSKYFLINFFVSVLLILIGGMCIIFKYESYVLASFVLAPFCFLVFVRTLNFFSKKYYKRDFHLHLRSDNLIIGNKIKASAFDNLCSVLVVTLPILLSLLFSFLISAKN